jgi:hypothetical protein
MLKLLFFFFEKAGGACAPTGILFYRRNKQVYKESMSHNRKGNQGTVNETKKINNFKAGIM